MVNFLKTFRFFTTEVLEVFHRGKRGLKSINILNPSFNPINPPKSLYKKYPGSFLPGYTIIMRW